MMDIESSLRARTTVALADCRAYVGTPQYRALDELLLAIEANYRLRLETVGEIDLRAVQAMLRQTAVLRECLGSSNGELPLVG